MHRVAMKTTQWTAMEDVVSIIARIKKEYSKAHRS
jgi:hypothetical protein